MTIMKISQISLAAMVALSPGFVMLGSGVANAQATDLVCNQCVGTSDIANGAVTVAKLAANAVNNSKIANGSVNAAKLATNAVTVSKLANSAVSTAKLATAAVTSAKLAPNAVKTTKIANAAVTAAKLAPNSVNGTKLTDGAVSGAKLGLKNTIFVDALGPTAADNCTALRTALAGISGNSASNPFVIHLGPGDYDCGTSTLVMKSHVDLAGAGMFATRILSQVSSTSISALELASSMELRDLTVENEAAFNANAIAVSNGSPDNKITGVYARSVADTTMIRFPLEVFVFDSGVVVLNSIVEGATGGIAVGLNANAVAVGSQLIKTGGGDPSAADGTIHCIGSYGETFAQLTSNCDP